MGILTTAPSHTLALRLFYGPGYTHSFANPGISVILVQQFIFILVFIQFSVLLLFSSSSLNFHSF